MNLLLLLTALLLYTKAEETKECKDYKFTGTMYDYEQMKGACTDLDGKIASEDLRDSENAEKARIAIETFRKDDGDSKIFLGITSRDMNNSPSRDVNPFVFSDDTVFEGESVFQWADSKPSQGYIDHCVYLGNDGKVSNTECGLEGKALCIVETACTDPESSGSALSRANLLLFALFMAGSVFNAFHALAGLVF